MNHAGFILQHDKGIVVFLEIALDFMKTIVLQSFRTTDIPYWLQSCLDSTKRWALASGWEYELLDDSFFDMAPGWIHERCKGNIYALTDVCRLQWLSDKLSAGYERVIWADADILVFAPQYLELSQCENYAFAGELFLQVFQDGRVKPVHGINNALMMFEQQQTILQTYLDTCIDRLQKLPAGVVPRTELGPSMLTEFNQDNPLNVIDGVGLFTLAIMQDIAVGNGNLCKEYKRHSSAPMGAANLCHFLRNNAPVNKRPKFDLLYDNAVNKLLTSKGEIINS